MVEPHVRTLEVGKTYLLSSCYAVAATNNNGEAYPWGSKYAKVPVRVKYDDSRFWTVTVLPHKYLGGYGISHPYDVTVDKFDFEHGLFTAIEQTYDDTSVIDFS